MVSARLQATAAPEEVPQPLPEQLRVGGKLVAPIGEEWADQELIVLTRVTADQLDRRTASIVRFVPMTGEAERR